MKIELTNKEWYAICHAEIGKKAKRKLFGTAGLTDKIWSQFITKATQQEIDEIKKEWDAIPAQQDMTPKKVKVPVHKPIRIPTTRNVRKGETEKGVWRA